MSITKMTLENSIPWPEGDNATDTILGGHHLNLTLLKQWNYTLYQNHTLSNFSKCKMALEPHFPYAIFANGSFANSTTCYRALNKVGDRGLWGIAFVVMYALCLFFILPCLHKHGQLHLPVERRFFPIGRRWQWYWGSFVCACGMIGLFANVDVDRYYLPSVPIVITSFFWYLMQMGAMAIVWEAIRHWNSWSERQWIDPNPFAYPQFDQRGMFEFWLPMVYYLFLWMNFFLIIPQSWSKTQYQRSQQQIDLRAKPFIHAPRFKAAAVFLSLCYVINFISLCHTIWHYKPRARSWFYQFFAFFYHCPVRFYFILPLQLIMIVYQWAVCYNWDIHPVNIHANVPSMFLGGHLPMVLIMLIQCIWGAVHPNEDLELIRQRRIRERQIDDELGIVHRPAWWKRVTSDDHLNLSVLERLRRRVAAVGGGRRRDDAAVMTDEGYDPSGANYRDEIEMSKGKDPKAKKEPKFKAPKLPTPYTGRSEARRSERAMEIAAKLLFPDAAPRITQDRLKEIEQEGPSREYVIEQKKREADRDRKRRERDEKERKEREKRHQEEMERRRELSMGESSARASPSTVNSRNNAGRSRADSVASTASADSTTALNPNGQVIKSMLDF